VQNITSNGCFLILLVVVTTNRTTFSFFFRCAAFEGSLRKMTAVFFVNITLNLEGTYFLLVSAISRARKLLFFVSLCCIFLK
jgi:hypothetical protein